MSLSIGSIKLQPGLALAPMAGITNHPFRVLAKELGCRLLYSEMISAKGLLHENKRSRALLYFTEQERPIGFQLFGSDPHILARAAGMLEEHGADFIDLNLGCPTPKITSNGDGGALMRSPEKCRNIFKAVTAAVSCPVTVKMRMGWNRKSVNCHEIALLAEEAGLKAVTLHGRTVDQGYGGQADWTVIKELKEKLAIPVIGNGDVDSPQAAERMLAFCRCDGIMIGRAARGNPWIFKSIISWLQDGEITAPPSLQETSEMILRHFSLLIALKGEAAAAREMRRHAAWYIKGFPGAASIRQKLFRVSGLAEMEEILHSYSLRHG